MNLETHSGELSFNSNQSKCQTVRLWSLQRNQWKSFELGKDTDILFLLFFFFLSLNPSHACPLLGRKAIFLCKNIKKKPASGFPFILLFWDKLVYGLNEIKWLMNKSTLSSEIITEIIVFTNCSSDEWITPNETHHWSIERPCLAFCCTLSSELSSQISTAEGRGEIPAAVHGGEAGWGTRVAHGRLWGARCELGTPPHCPYCSPRQHYVII